MSRARLRRAVEALGGIGKKQLKKLEKTYQDLGREG
jgi:glutamyl-tRNA synthetase